MENLFFLILVAVVGLIQWIVGIIQERKKAEAERQAGNPPPRPIAAPRTQQTTTGAPVSPEEERVRKFMEALGVPTAPAPSAPPPPPQSAPRQAAPPPPPQQQRPPKPPKVRPIDPFPKPRVPARPATPPPPPVMAPAAPTPRYDRPPPLPTSRTSMFRPAPAEPDAYAVEVPTAYELPSHITTAETGAPHRPEMSLIAARLATREGLQEAVVLREIFGPPRSMQPLAPHSVR